MTNFYGLLCLASGRVASERPADDAPELHLNLWEQPSRVALDIGLMIHRGFAAQRIYFYLPWPSEGRKPTDLATRINYADAIAAIFNESWAVTQPARSSSVTVTNPADGKTLFQVVSASNYLAIEEEPPGAHRICLDFDQLIQKENPQADKIYLRFRIAGVPPAFYSVGFTQGDQGLVSSWAKDEFIDFRLNVRRGAPPDLETRVGRYLSFSKVHLFLMRHRSNELVFQDEAFRSCRSLEDEGFWAKYSHENDQPSHRELEATRAHVTNSLGYQWSKRISHERPVHEFGILARFKRIELSIRRFLLYALLIGAAGNAAWSAFVWIVEHLLVANLP